MNHIKYDEHELLELFESEPSVVFEEETGVFIYSKVDVRGIKLTMLISIYENQCRLGLSCPYQDYDSPIFNIEVRDVEKIKSTSEKVEILRRSDRNIEVYFKPNFIFKLEEAIT